MMNVREKLFELRIKLYLKMHIMYKINKIT